MARKSKTPTPITAPVTREEFIAFAKTWEKLKPVVEALSAPLSAVEDTRYGGFPRYEWSDYEGLHDISDRGVWFYQVKEDRYDDYRTAHTYFVPLEVILDPEPHIQKHEDRLNQLNQDRLDYSEQSERATYERLRIKFEGK